VDRFLRYMKLGGRRNLEHARSLTLMDSQLPLDAYEVQNARDSAYEFSGVEIYA
jgi:hypothetical protein